jgi:hypothetical protein
MHAQSQICQRKVASTYQYGMPDAGHVGNGQHDLRTFNSIPQHVALATPKVCYFVVEKTIIIQVISLCSSTAVSPTAENVQGWQCITLLTHVHQTVCICFEG